MFCELFADYDTGVDRPIGEVLHDLWSVQEWLAACAIVAVVCTYCGEIVGSAIGDVFILDAT